MWCNGYVLRAAVCGGALGATLGSWDNYDMFERGAARKLFLLSLTMGGVRVHLSFPENEDGETGPEQILGFCMKEEQEIPVQISFFTVV